VDNKTGHNNDISHVTAAVAFVIIVRWWFTTYRHQCTWKARPQQRYL